MPLFLNLNSAPAPAFECGAACYDAAAKSRFWGFAVAVEPLSGPGAGVAGGVGAMLADIEREGYDYLLVAPQPGGAPDARVASGARAPAAGAAAAAVVRTPADEDW